ncbi:MAG: exodeoxyribonuclease III [Acidiferrobacterales bacterium]
MKIATWNVNSLRVRLNHVLNWISTHQPDILCLQETKITDADFPLDEIRQAGYVAVYAGQKTYNGVAILSRMPAEEVEGNIHGLSAEQKRMISATYGELRVLNVYVPNGQTVGSEKYAYKLDWLDRLTAYIAEQLKRYPQLALLGDFNIAPAERDVHDPVMWEGSVLFSDKERAAFRMLLGTGLIDVFRKFEQPPNSFTWWDYRVGAFRRDLGLRIDHILCSAPLSDKCTGCTIDKEPRRRERPSDHAPVLAEFAIDDGG